MHTSFLFWARGLFDAVSVFAFFDEPIVGVTFTTTIHGAILDKIWSYEVKQLNKNATYLWANWTTILASWLAAIRTLAPHFVRFLTAFAFGYARSSFESTNIARGTDATSSLGAKLNFWVKFLKNCIKKHEKAHKIAWFVWRVTCPQTVTAPRWWHCKDFIPWTCITIIWALIDRNACFLVFWKNIARDTITSPANGTFAHLKRVTSLIQN